MTSFKVLLFAAGDSDRLLDNSVSSIVNCGVLPRDLVVARFESDFERHALSVPGTSHLVLDELSSEPPPAGYANYGTTEFTRLIDLRFRAMLYLLNAGTNLIYSDIDISWIADPRSYLERVLSVYDCTFQTEPISSFPPMFCTGFFACRPSRRSLDILEAHFAAFKEERARNPQATMQAVLVRLLETEVQWLKSCFPLPEALFPTGLLHRIMDRSNEFDGILGSVKPYLFHANWVYGNEGKERLLRHVGLWQTPRIASAEYS